MPILLVLYIQKYKYVHEKGLTAAINTRMELSCSANHSFKSNSHLNKRQQVRAGSTLLEPADVQGGRTEVNLIPAQVHQLGHTAPPFRSPSSLRTGFDTRRFRRGSRAPARAPSQSRPGASLRGSPPASAGGRCGRPLNLLQPIVRVPHIRQIEANHTARGQQLDLTALPPDGPLTTRKFLREILIGRSLQPLFTLLRRPAKPMALGNAASDHPGLPMSGDLV
jgi:hypothetical protein